MARIMDEVLVLTTEELTPSTEFFINVDGLKIPIERCDRCEESFQIRCPGQPDHYPGWYRLCENTSV
jgi:hypothetical protein